MTITADGEFKSDLTTQRSIIIFNTFHLLFEPMIDTPTRATIIIQKEFPDEFGQFAKEFAEVILITTSVVIT